MNIREGRLLYFVVAVAIFTLALSYFIIPAIDNYRRLSRQIDVSQANLVRYARLLSQKNVIKDKYNDLFAGARPAGSRQDAAVEVLSRLESFAKSADIRIVDVRPQVSIGEPVSGEVAIELRVEGSLDSYAEFIYDIENPLSLLSIKTVQLTAKPASRTLEGSLLIYGFPAVD